MTWDQGAEMAHHDTLESLFAEGIFFAHPASPWQRGSNENTNGLLRQYFPKKTDLHAYGVEPLAEAEHRLNHRPRKGLDWRTPAEVFTRRPAMTRSLTSCVATTARIHLWPAPAVSTPSGASRPATGSSATGRPAGAQ